MSVAGLDSGHALGAGEVKGRYRDIACRLHELARELDWICEEELRGLNLKAPDGRAEDDERRG